MPVGQDGIVRGVVNAAFPVRKAGPSPPAHVNLKVNNAGPIYAGSGKRNIHFTDLSA
jgi:hypothetical protein